MTFSHRWLFPTAALCLWLSGIAGLVYQVVWARYLALFLGHTSYAVVAVLVAFMGGLALGNAWLGRYADRLERPLALYAWLEIGIAAYAVLFPAYFELCQSAYVRLAQGTESGSTRLLVLRFAFSGVAILIPTVLMGGTLPVLTRLVTRTLGELRARVGSLYFINSAGAVAGVLIADFWWIPAYGLDATVLGAAALNALVGGLALIASTVLREGTTARAAPHADARLPETPSIGRPKSTDAESDAAETFSAGELRLALAAAGLSGFVAMLYEIVWTRLLGLALGSSTHAFPIMLVTFISGIAAGAWWIGRTQRLKRTFDAFGWAELALAVSLLVSMFFYHLLPYGFIRLGAVLARTPSNYALYQLIQFLVCFAVMFAPAVCLGMTLPLASRVATSEVARTGRSVGLVFSVNTVGTVLGAALGGLLLLPSLGLARSFALGVGLNLVLALAVLARRNSARFKAVLALSPCVVLGVLLMAASFLRTSWESAFSLGMWRSRGVPSSLAEYNGMIRAMDVRYYKDGAGSSVAVNTWTNPVNGRMELALRVNGKADATTQGDLATQLLLSHIPLLLKPAAENVLVIGVGSGTTCASALAHPSVTRVDAVEISPEVAEAAGTLFAAHNRRVLEDSRVSLIIDDAKSHLKTSGRTYDVIISEPSNPWMAGVAGVFTREFYETCRNSLKPGGLMVQWVHIYESNDATLSTVLATLAASFPFISLWQTLPGDLVLVASLEPVPYDLEAIRQRFQVPSVTEDLRRGDIFRLPVLLGLQLVSEVNGAFLVPADTIQHSDFFPTLEYMAAKGFFVREVATLHERFDETSLPRPATLLGRYLKDHPLDVTDLQSFALFHTTFKVPTAHRLRSLVERWRQVAPDPILAAEFSSNMDVPLPASELEALRMQPLLSSIIANAGTDPEPLRTYARHRMRAYRSLRSAYYRPDAAELEKVLQHLAESDPTHRATHQLRLAELAWDRGDDSRFFQLATDALIHRGEHSAVGQFSLDEQAPGHVLYLLIESLWRLGRHADAAAWCRAARDGGYLNVGSRHYNPRLAMVVRRTEVIPP